MIFILPSADYEFYLGQNHLPEHEVLFEPTEQLLNLYESLGLRTTLFCDVACIWRYREWGKESIASQMERQMVDAITRGHDVQAHLHPHWLQTEMINGRYLFAEKDFLLGSLRADLDPCRQIVEQLLTRTVTYLQNLLQPMDPNYRCLAFRAGGYGLQPREKMILAALIQSGFVMDSSIIPGLRHHTSTHQVDFSKVPRQANYWLHPQGGIEDPGREGEGLLEIPIPGYHATPWQAWRINLPEALRQGANILLGLTKKQQPRGQPCGVATKGHTAPETSRLRQAYWRSRAMLNTRFHRLEAGPSLKIMESVLEGYLASLPHHPPSIYLSLISHPKGMSARHFNVLRRFHQRLQRYRRDSFRCITFREAWHQQAEKLRSLITNP
ncbi:MAG: hypothetical protein HQL78_03015 [Magnetococcales bacterium]|nr:hypothetical protein [Magnetococcales bacterium]